MTGRRGGGDDRLRGAVGAPIAAILWDFGDTLCDETFMRAPMPGRPDWKAVYDAALARDGLVERWDLGLATTSDVASAVAGDLGVSTDRVIAHMEWCCRNIRFFDGVMALVAERRRPQAIVTVNPDIFSRNVVPAHGLDGRFEMIVTSWQEGTASKADHCDIAAARLGGLRRESCLLIDNKLANVVEWRARGGAAIHFADPQQFLETWAHALI